MSSDKTGQSIIICKQCGFIFGCGHNNVNGQCWCNNLPNIMPLKEGVQNSEDCYCPRCLEEIISKKIAAKP
jgi:uncharacterized protein